MTQAPREELREILMELVVESQREAQGGDDVFDWRADISVGLTLSAILGVFRSLPAMQEEMGIDAPGLPPYLRDKDAVARNVLRRQILAELEAQS